MRGDGDRRRRFPCIACLHHARRVNFLGTLIRHASAFSVRGLIIRVRAPSLWALLVTSVRRAARRLSPRLAARLGAVPLPSVAAGAQVEHHRAQAAPNLAQAALMVGVLRTGPQESCPISSRPTGPQMARRNRVSKARKRERRRRRHAETVGFEQLVQDTAARFTCFALTCDDFAYQCQSGREALECDLAFNRVAAEIWAGRPGGARELAEALAALAAERERHLGAITVLGERFEALAADHQGLHEHLEPIECYRDLVRRRIFPNRS